MADTTTTATISAARIAQIPAEHAALASHLQANHSTLTADEVEILANILNQLADEHLRLTGQRLS